MVKNSLLDPTRDNQEAGFTLVEMVAVAVLLSMLSLVLYGTLDGIINARAAILNRSKAGATARIVVERMTRELNGIVVGVTLSAEKQEGEQQDQGVTPGSSFGRSFNSSAKAVAMPFTPRRCHRVHHRPNGIGTWPFNPSCTRRLSSLAVLLCYYRSRPIYHHPKAVAQVPWPPF